MFVPAPPAELALSGRPLIVSADPGVRGELVRLGVAAGAEPELVDSVDGCRAAWSAARIVLVGGDLAGALAAAGLPRRTGVWVVIAGAPDVRDYAAALAIGADDVVALTDAVASLVGSIADAVEGDGTHARVIGVIGGRGGAGATTLAVALAVTARRRGLRTMLIDADPLGGGIDLALGAEQVGGLRWDDLTGTTGRVSAAALHDSLVHAHQLTVLSWGRSDLPTRLATTTPASMQATLLAGCRAHDLLVVDLPRHLDDAARVALERAATVFVVVPAEVRAAAAARRVVARVGLVPAPLRLVVRGPAPTGVSAAMVADSVGLPLSAELRAEPRLASALDRGEPPALSGRGPLARFAARVLTDLTTGARPVAA